MGADDELAGLEAGEAGGRPAELEAGEASAARAVDGLIASPAPPPAPIDLTAARTVLGFATEHPYAVTPRALS